MNQNFELGQIVTTTTLFNYCKERRFLLLPYLLRHANCDWGSVCEEDKKRERRIIEKWPSASKPI